MARVSAFITCLVTGALLVWLAIASAGPDPIVLPRGGVEGGPQDAVPAGESARATLRERTQLQRWRGQSGPAPEGARSDAVRGTQLNSSARDAAPDVVMKQWLAQREEEDTVLYPAEFLRGSASLPSDQAEVLEQPQGREFRRLHNGAVTYGGGLIVLGVTFLLALFLLLRGRVRIAEGFSERWVHRFNALERGNHWMTAGSFVMLALSGLLLLYGQFLVKPLVGAGVYGELAGFGLLVHIAFMPAFMIGVAVMTVLWARENLGSRLDLTWIRRFGGLLNDQPNHPPARRFNFGQKAVFWGVVLGALVLFASGITLMFPFFWTGVVALQWTLLAHGAVGLLMVGLILGHIYIGTIGMQGAIDAMWSGRVDYNWAREHHSEWVKQLDRRQIGEAR